MKQKTSNMLNILLIAITLLLIFVATANAIGKTGSWLTDKDEVGFTTKVAPINIVITQTLNKDTANEESVTVENDGTITLGTDYIEANKPYALNVTITNGEEGSGYYVRYQAIAIVNGTEYNINEYITTDFYQNTDGWAYHTASNQSATPTQMAEGETKILMGTMTIPATADNGKLSIGTLQGKHFKLFLYIEGSPSADFLV